MFVPESFKMPWGVLGSILSILNVTLQIVILFNTLNSK